MDRSSLRRTSARGVKREASPDVVEVTAEPARKRRANTDRKSSATKTKDVAPVLTETPVAPAVARPTAPLPTKITNDQPMPLLNAPQPLLLSDREYQTIAESGVIALSLERSRHACIHDAIFERFWSKAHYKKKKDAEMEVPKTPSAGSQQGAAGPVFGHQKSAGTKPAMTKVGECRMTIEPLIFDITLYVVKDPNPLVQLQSSPSVHPKLNTTPALLQLSNGYNRSDPPVTKAQDHRTPVQSPAPMRIQTSHGFSTPTPQAQAGAARVGPVQPGQTRAGLSAPRDLTNTGSAIPQSATPKSAHDSSVRLIPPSQKSSQQRAMTSTQSPSTEVLKPPMPNSRPESTASVLKTEPSVPLLKKEEPSPAPSPAPSTEQSQPNPDPVIAILAERAQANTRLKEIMQIVAKGEATTQQLSYFQGHITDISAIVERRKREEEARKRREHEARHAAAARARTANIWAASRNSHTTTSSQVKLPSAPSPQSGFASNSLSNNTVRSSGALATKPKPTGASNMQGARLQAPSPLGSGMPMPISNTTSQQRTVQGQATPTQSAARYPSQSAQPNSIDRFLFPIHSMLEFSPDGKSCLCSFLVVRAGSRAADPAGHLQTDAPKGKTSAKAAGPKDKSLKAEEAVKEVEFYQPVTATFASDDPTVMSYLAKVVKPRDEVLKHMKDVMRRAKRAENFYLPRRLPRKKAIVGEEDPVALST